MKGIQFQLLSLVLAVSFCWCMPTSIICDAAPQAPASSAPGNSSEESPQVSGFSVNHSPFAPPPVLTPDGLQPEESTFRPFLYWRSWANQKLPLYRVFIFLFFGLSTISLVSPRLISAAREPYEKKWLRCFGIGGLFFTFGLAAAGGMARLGLFAPLAMALVATVQLCSLIGLTVAAEAIGESVLKITRLSSAVKHPVMKRLVPLWIGVVVLSAITVIPGIGIMPRIGNRMLALISAAGAGALWIIFRKKRQELM